MARSLVFLRSSVFLVLGVALAACGGRDPAPPLPGSDPVSAASDGEALGAAPPLPIYRMGPSDGIRLTVFRHEDLSGEFQLDSEGNFSMPLIGEVAALDLSTRELEDSVETRLRDGYLVDPQVSIEVLTYRPFYILGEVTTPGQYEFVSGMTAQTAVALAGGYTERAQRERFLLQRGGSNARQTTVSADTPLAPGDIVTIDERFF